MRGIAASEAPMAEPRRAMAPEPAGREDEAMPVAPIPANALPLEAERQARRAKRLQAGELIRQRRTQVHGLHLGGASFRQIGQALGVSAKTACIDFRRERDALAALEREPNVARR